MKLLKAITLAIGELEYPVITSYQIGLIIFNLYKTRRYNGEFIAGLKKESPDLKTFNRILTQLQDEGILTLFKGFPKNSVFNLLGRSYGSAEDIACTVDPFCYVSHLSAMEFHGLTNRLPGKLFISSPSPKAWKAFALERMEKDLKDDLAIYRQNKMPELKKTRLDKIGKKEIHRFNSVHLGAYRKVKGRAMRVSTIGRTFLDMLRNPDLCGGINHVLEIYEEFAGDYVNLIIDEIDQHGGAIDKVRAGYVLDERLGIIPDKVNDWLKYVQRGGSRKLDASGEYEPVFSEKWCISLNVMNKP